MNPTVLLLLTFIWGCSAEMKRYTYHEPKMGSIFIITLFAKDSLAGREAAYEAFERIDEINLALSDYTEESETWQINAHPTTEWIPASDDLLSVLVTSGEVVTKTQSAFDPAIGNLVQLWRRARRKQQLPADSTIAAALSGGGYHTLEIDTSAHKIRFVTPGVKLDFGGIGKGYAMDEALATLRENGFEHSFVSASSSIAAGDAPVGQNSWQFLMGINTPAGEGVNETIYCDNCFIASSGDLYQYMELDGKRYSHIIDPSSGQALTSGAFAIVIAPSATLADAYATAFCVMKPEEVRFFLGVNTDVQAKVWRDGGGEFEVITSAGFDDYIKSP